MKRESHRPHRPIDIELELNDKCSVLCKARARTVIKSLSFIFRLMQTNPIYQNEFTHICGSLLIGS